MKRNHEAGFTLIELIIVIAIIAILAAVAIPKYYSLTTNAQSAALSAIAGALASANSNNYGIRSMNPALGQSITNCTQVANLLQEGLPSGYIITSLAVAVNASVTCTLAGPNNLTANFTATGIN